MKLIHGDIFMLLVPALFWHGGGTDRKVQWQCVRKANKGEATVCSQAKQVSSDSKQPGR